MELSTCGHIVTYLNNPLFSSELREEKFLFSLAIQYHKKCDYPRLKSTYQAWQLETKRDPALDPNSNRLALTEIWGQIEGLNRAGY